MASLEQIRDAIAEIAQRQKNVEFSEIERIVGQVGRLPGYSTDIKRTKETLLVRINTERFTVSDHHHGSKQLKPVYVKSFLRAMINLGLYED